jgi:aldose 1-epimerase
MPDYDNLLVHLRHGDWEADIFPAFGANLIRLAHAGREILRTAPDLASLLGRTILYGTPVLVPANRTADGRFTFDGKEYQLPINEPRFFNNLHGSLYLTPFRVVQVDADSCACEYASSKFDAYTFNFSLTITVTLTDAGMKQEFVYKNLGEGPMPITMSLHTSFVRPADFSVPVAHSWETDARALPTGRMLPLTAQESQYPGGYTLCDEFVNGYYTSVGHKARVGDYHYEVSDNFDQWVLFGAGPFDFLCVEPQIAQVNCLNHPGSFPVLPAGESFTCWTKITPVKA